MSQKLSNNKLKIAVVTGAGSGIGLSIVLKLLKNGYVVYACTGSRTKNSRNYLIVQNKLCKNDFL